jgi:hypothetical protein
MVLDVVSLPAAMSRLALEFNSACVNLQGLSESSASRCRKTSLREEPSFWRVASRASPRRRKERTSAVSGR